MPKDKPSYKSFWLCQILGVIPTFGLVFDFFLRAEGLFTIFLGPKHNYRTEEPSTNC
jgi:hypothetical protein